MMLHHVTRGVVFCLLLAMANAVFAMPPTKRNQQWEFTLQVNQQDSVTFNGDQGSSLELDSSTGWGFGLGYNFSNKLNLRFDFVNNDPKYTSTAVSDDPSEEPSVISHRMTNYAGNFNLTYSFLDGPLTPYVEGGVGWMTVDSNIVSGIRTGCYWTYYGYFCSNYASTYTSSSWTYNAAAGVRWDIADNFFMKAAVGQQRSEYGDGREGINFGRVEFGWKLGRGY